VRFVGHENSELMASRYKNAISVLLRKRKEPIECDKISDNDAVTWHNFTKTDIIRAMQPCAVKSMIEMKQEC